MKRFYTSMVGVPATREFEATPCRPRHEKCLFYSTAWSPLFFAAIFVVVGGKTQWNFSLDAETAHIYMVLLLGVRMGIIRWEAWLV